jgi:allantoinase
MDCAFIGGVVRGNAAEVRPLLEAGVTGFKCFLIHSGVDEFPHVTKEQAREALQQMKNYGGYLMFHAEVDTTHEHHASDQCQERAAAATAAAIASDSDSSTSNASSSASASSASTSSNSNSDSSNSSNSANDSTGTDHKKKGDDTLEDSTRSTKKAKLDPVAYETFLHSRPKEMENKAIEMVISLCRETGVRCHIVHLSSAEALPLIRQAKKDGVNISVETCYHYLFLEAESIPNGSTEFKCCPPIREHDNRELLWQGLLDGTIDLVVSDHSPCTAELKLKEKGDFMAAWGGIASLQFGLSILHTEAVRRGVKLEQLSKWLCEQPAKLLGIDGFKGKIAVGHDADLVIFNPNKKWSVSVDQVQHRNKLTPYAGKEFVGKVEKTILRGRVIAENGKVVTNAGDRIGRTILVKHNSGDA